MKKLLILTGEVSGDIQASMAIERFKKIYPLEEVEMRGLGGENLEKVGVSLFKDTDVLGSIGFLENLTSIFTILSLFKEVKAMIREWRPDLLLLVDSPGFNLRFLSLAKELDIPALLYFGPSVWIWGERRAKKVIKEGAHIAAVFKPEEELYKRMGGKVHFVGHPIVDRPINQKVLEDLKKELGRSTVIGLLPGSRKKELKTLLPLMLETARVLKERDPSLSFILPLAPGIQREEYQEIFDQGPEVLIVRGMAREVMALSTLLIISSGTATLEAALLQVPMVIVYKTSRLNASIFYLLGARYAGMPNILLDQLVVPELLQRDLTLSHLLDEVERLLQSQKDQEKMRERLALVKERLGPPGALDRMAHLMKDFL